LFRLVASFSGARGEDDKKFRVFAADIEGRMHQPSGHKYCVARLQRPTFSLEPLLKGPREEIQDFFLTRMPMEIVTAARREGYERLGNLL
jgi:hypothetical protein